MCNISLYFPLYSKRVPFLICSHKLHFVKFMCDASLNFVQIAIVLFSKKFRFFFRLIYETFNLYSFITITHLLRLIAKNWIISDFPLNKLYVSNEVLISVKNEIDRKVKVFK